MTRLKNREPATDLPSALMPPVSNFHLKDEPLEDKPLEDKPPEDKLPDAIPESQKKASSWRKLGRAIRRYPNVSQMVLFLTLIGGTSVVLLTLLFKDAWSDRHNNLAIISTILKMELNRDDARVLDESPERVVTHTFRTLEPHLETDGWTWLSRFGNTITYGKQDRRMIASCTPYSPLYMVCDLGEIPK